jgi:hypothetical protein
MAAYRAATQRAQKQKDEWVRRSAKIICSRNTGNLCGWDVTSEDASDVLSILASPAAYDSRLPEHTGTYALKHML